MAAYNLIGFFFHMKYLDKHSNIESQIRKYDIYIYIPWLAISGWVAVYALSISNLCSKR